MFEHPKADLKMLMKSKTKSLLKIKENFIWKVIRHVLTSLEFLANNGIYDIFICPATIFIDKSK